VSAAEIVAAALRERWCSVAEIAALVPCQRNRALFWIRLIADSQIVLCQRRTWRIREYHTPDVVGAVQAQ
jgi:hypothetical protein